jgi:hypothetical protein
MSLEHAPLTAQGLKPITVTVNVALALTGIGRSKFYYLVAAGKIKTVKLQGKTLVNYASLEELMPGDTTDDAGRSPEGRRARAAAAEAPKAPYLPPLREPSRRCGRFCRVLAGLPAAHERTFNCGARAVLSTTHPRSDVAGNSQP